MTDLDPDAVSAACCEHHSAVGCTDDPPYTVCCLNCPINGTSLRVWREKVLHGDQAE